MILGLLILTAALERTGVADLAGRAVLRRAEANPDRLLWIVMLASAGLGAFISNTASAAFFLPVVLGIASIRHQSIKTPHAPCVLLDRHELGDAREHIHKYGGEWHDKRLSDAPMGMFELAPVGLPIAAVGLVYMFLARRFIPDRVPPAELIEEFGVRPYLSEIVVQPGSNLAGKTLGESSFAQQLGLTVLRILRDKKRLPARADAMVQEGDTLIVEGSQADLLKIKDTAGVEIVADAHVSIRILPRKTPP